MTSEKKKILERYIPEEFIGLVTKLLKTYPVRFRIVKPRKTKLGDFRVDERKEKKYSITINGNLNQYSFLITTLHEFAHLVVHLKHGRHVKSHGAEWKSEFRKLLVPVIESEHTPKDIKTELEKSMLSIKASSCTQLGLQRVLMKYDANSTLTALEGLDKNSIFDLNGRVFMKGKLRRTRFFCTELSTKKGYLINALAMVKEIDNER